MTFDVWSLLKEYAPKGIRWMAKMILIWVCVDFIGIYRHIIYLSDWERFTSQCSVWISAQVILFYRLALWLRIFVCMIWCGRSNLCILWGLSRTHSSFNTNMGIYPIQLKRYAESWIKSKICLYVCSC